MNVLDIYKIIDRFAPFDLAEEFDNVGLLVGDKKSQVKNILLCLDVTPDVLLEARTKATNLIISHHPVIFDALKGVDTSSYLGRILKEAMKMDMNIICAHTNLDSTKGGLNDYLAGLYGLTDIHPLVLSKKYIGRGIGRVGSLKKTVTLKDLAGSIKKLLNTNLVRFVGDPAKKIKKVALCSGSGSSFFREAKLSGADCYISGELKHSMALEALNMGLALIDVSHYASEIVCLEILERVLTKNIKAPKRSPQVFRSIEHNDPFQLR